MYVEYIFIHTCQLIVLLNFTHSYVLFAANLDDFRSIAKKFIPDKLADQLTNMAAQKSMKYRQQHKLTNIDTKAHRDKTEEYSDELTTTEFKPTEIVTTTPKKRFTIKDQKDIDFDELVDRVREQLENKFKDKLDNKQTINQDDYYDDESDNTKELQSNDEIATHNNENTKNNIANAKTTLKTIQTTKSTTESIYYDNEGEAAKPLAEDDQMHFKEAVLTKTNDSYEDYVIPDKANIFESDETTTKSQRVHSEEQSKYKDQILKAVLTEKKKRIPSLEEQDYIVHKSEEVKAKTEKLSDETDVNEIPKKLKGTMIPTREYYKMSSPNYYAGEAVAEKYDFNEPLPEKDREPESLKHFANPPSSINKKVQLTGNL